MRRRRLAGRAWSQDAPCNTVACQVSGRSLSLAERQSHARLFHRPAEKEAWRLGNRLQRGRVGPPHGARHVEPAGAEPVVASSDVGIWPDLVCGVLEDIGDLGARRGGHVGHHQRGGSRNQRRRHRGAVLEPIAAGDGAQNLIPGDAPRRSQVDIGLVTRVAGPIVVMIGCRDRKHLRVGGRVVVRIGRATALGAALSAVAGGRDHERIATGGVVDGIAEVCAGVDPSQAQVNDLGIVVGGASNGQSDVAVGADALRIERLQRQNPHVGGQPSHAYSVVGRSPDDAGHVRAVAIVVAWVKIPVDVVISRRQTPGELGMRAVDAGVDHRHHEGIGAEGEIPRLGRTDAAHVPLVADVWIVGVAGGMCEVVQLGVAHPGQRR